MDDLTELFRPKRYQDVIGQQDIVARLKAQLATHRFRPVCVSGPPGSGKSVLGEIYAKASLCRSPNDGQACDECPACTAYAKQENIDFLHHRSAEKSRIDDVLEAVSFLKQAPLISRRRVAYFEECASLSSRSWHALLEITEHPPAWAAMIFVTSEADHLSPALISRVTMFETQPLNSVEATDYLARICEQIRLPFDRDGLALIHAENSGIVRAMLRSLEQVRLEGAARLQDVRNALRLNVFSHLERYVEALDAGNLGKQIDIIDAWNDTPAQKLTFLHRAFVDAYLAIDRGVHGRDSLMANFSLKVGPSLNGLIMSRAADLKQPASGLWNAIIDVAEPELKLSASQLRMRITSIDDLLRQPRQIHRRNIEPIRPKPRKVRLPPNVNPNYSNWRQVRAIWRTASFLPLRYGQLFNARLSIYHRGALLGDHDAAAELVSTLTHQLGMRIADWGGTKHGPRLHWMYQHEADATARLVTRLILSVPHSLQAGSERWLAKFFRKPRWSRAIEGYHFSQRAGENLRFHWACVRVLCRSLDPAIMLRSSESYECSVADLMKLPRRLRQEVGEIKCAQARGSSGTLSAKQQALANEALPVISALDDRAWPWLDSGWELHEYCDRRIEIERRRSLREEVEARFPSVNAISDARKAEELKLLEATFEALPMRRSWQTWWKR